MTRRRGSLVARAAMLVVVCALMIAPSALAQGGSAETTYAGPGGNNTRQVDEGAGAPSGDDDEGGLPFTGLDLLLALGGGLVLLTTGIGISRLVARDEIA